MNTILIYISIFIKIIIIFALIFIVYKINNMSENVVIEKYEDNVNENIQILISAANIAKDDADNAANNINTQSTNIISAFQNAEDKLKNAHNLVNIAFNLAYSTSKTLNYIEPEQIQEIEKPKQQPEEDEEETPQETPQEQNNNEYDESLSKEIILSVNGIIKSSK